VKPRTSPNQPCRRLRRGLSLVEVMISLVISALLLAAVAVAFSATTSAVEINDRFFRASQTARVAMAQMVAAARKSDVAQVGTSAQQSLSFIDNASNLDVDTPDGESLSYVFDAASRQLRLIVRQPTGDVTRVLARDIKSCQFDGTIEPHPQTAVRRLVRVTIHLVVEVENQQLLLSGSVVPRREMVY
jgi:prepilin-type N-terminal cleavage/methylation domain-containing protein